MRPFPHSTQGVHTYRNHAEIYSTPRRHVWEIIWDKSRPEKPSSRAPLRNAGFWEGFRSQSYITGPHLINALLSYFNFDPRTISYHHHA